MAFYIKVGGFRLLTEIIDSPDPGSEPMHIREQGYSRLS